MLKGNVVWAFGALRALGNKFKLNPLFLFVMRFSKKLFFGLSVFALLFVLGCAQSNPKTDAFAKCLTDKGAKFYGAYWCLHCLEQKKDFGGSVDKLNYIECAIQGQNGQTQACIDAQIKSYPTWTFADGSRLEGRLPLSTLAQKTGCEAP